MTTLQFAQGHNNSGDLAPFLYQPDVTKDIDFNVEYTANGVAKRIGGGDMVVEWAYLEDEELITLMDFLGVHQREPSTQGTFLLPDWYRIPTIMNGQITLRPLSRQDGVWQDVIADITGLEYL